MLLMSMHKKGVSRLSSVAQIQPDENPGTGTDVGAVTTSIFNRLSAEQIQRMYTAAAVVLDTQRLFAKTGDNVVGEVLRGQGEFVEWNHYPDGDVYDPHTHAQYYYHAHPPEGRPLREHGHFHLFLRPKGMPAGIRPFAGQELPSGDNDALSHLVAIAMDRYGAPIRLFTTNRWVTGDIWYRADDVIRMLDAFEVEVVRPNLAVNRWLTAMVRLFYPQIVGLLHVRDQAVKEWRLSHTDTDVFEDRRLETTSIIDIDVDEQATRVFDALHGIRGGPPAA
jgi:hypothetical protein